MLQQSPMKWFANHMLIKGRIDATESPLDGRFAHGPLSTPAERAAVRSKLQRRECAGTSMVHTDDRPWVA